jgi:(R,R)-butanediol dehydrogenase/meso-butanediol dehydrogenase/diacetyl reductase
VLPDLTDTQASLIEPAAVAVYAVDRGHVAAGSSVLVSDTGPIGALTLLAARAAGASLPFVAHQWQASSKGTAIVPGVIAINPKEQDVAAVIRSQTEGVAVDIAIACVGTEASLNACIDASRRQGGVAQADLTSSPRPSRR